jgi:hypothetical protein
MGNNLRKLLTTTFAIATLIKGFILLNLMLLPFSILIVLFIGIMGGGSPDSPGAVVSFGIAAAFIYLMPAGVMIGHVVFAKIFDTLVRIVPLRAPDVSVSGLAVSAVILVIAGNVFVDDLYQFRQGEYSLSIFALVGDLIGIAVVAGVGSVRIPFVDRIFGRPANAERPALPTT